MNNFVNIILIMVSCLPHCQTTTFRHCTTSDGLHDCQKFCCGVSSLQRKCLNTCLGERCLNDENCGNTKWCCVKGLCQNCSSNLNVRNATITYTTTRGHSMLKTSTDEAIRVQMNKTKTTRIQVLYISHELKTNVIKPTKRLGIKSSVAALSQSVTTDRDFLNVTSRKSSYEPTFFHHPAEKRGEPTVPPSPSRTAPDDNSKQSSIPGKTIGMVIAGIFLVACLGWAFGCKSFHCCRCKHETRRPQSQTPTRNAGYNPSINHSGSSRLRNTETAVVQARVNMYGLEEDEGGQSPGRTLTRVRAFDEPFSNRNYNDYNSSSVAVRIAEEDATITNLPSFEEADNHLSQRNTEQVEHSDEPSFSSYNHSISSVTSIIQRYPSNTDVPNDPPSYEDFVTQARAMNNVYTPGQIPPPYETVINYDDIIHI